MGNVEEIAGWFSDGYAVEQELKGAHIVHSCYETGYYEGSWVVIYIKKGEWYRAIGNHCSCNGPDWDPERTSREELLAYYDDPRDSDIRAMIEACAVVK